MASVTKEVIEVFSLQMTKREYDVLEKALGNITSDVANDLKLSGDEDSILDDIFNIM